MYNPPVVRSYEVNLQEVPMKELEDLGIRQVGVASDGTPIRKRFFKFECESCHNTFERIRSKGKAAKYCRECTMNKFNPAKKSGMSGSKPYNVWNAMKQRCDNPNDSKYHRYGGRGISYDPNWKTFEGFWKDMSSDYTRGLTIDRKDNDGNYTRANCRWIEGWDNSGRSKLRKVYQVKRIITYELIAEYESGNEAERGSGVSSTVISDVIANRRGSAQGFEWYNESGFEKLRSKYVIS